MKSMLKIIEKKTTNFVNISLLEIEAVKNRRENIEATNCVNIRLLKIEAVKIGSENIEATNFVNIRLLKFETVKIWRKKKYTAKKKIGFQGLMNRNWQKNPHRKNF